MLEVWLVVSPPSEDKQVTLDSLDKSNEGQNTMTAWLREQDPDCLCKCF